jgi:hypothetical protein
MPHLERLPRKIMRGSGDLRFQGGGGVAASELSGQEELVGRELGVIVKTEVGMGVSVIHGLW